MFLTIIGGCQVKMFDSLRDPETEGGLGKGGEVSGGSVLLGIL